MKAFRRFQRKEKIDDDALCEAIERAEQGLVDADLGGGLIKQRLARKGQGKSGGYRTIIAYRQGDRSYFLKGFAKSGQANIGPDEEEALAAQGRLLMDFDADGIDEAIADGALTEIDYDDEG